jgi:uroporphyrin-III C-methyltransferase/precorrin-2 dehydrogenase/sirohydrochlorin ferrochelatase
MRFWESLFDGAPAALIADGRSDDAEAAAEALLDALRSAPEAESIATLPVRSSDPDLLTVRAARLIRMAEVIFHEPGVAPSIVALGRHDALKIAVPRGSQAADLAIAGRAGLRVHLTAASAAAFV